MKNQYKNKSSQNGTSEGYHAIMLVDDNEIDNKINQKVILESGYADHVLLFTGAISALEFLRNLEQIAPTKLPGLILLDIDMPIMDGFQFLNEFEKVSENIRNSTSVVMLTSSFNPKDVEKTKKSPYVKEYLNKPLSQDSLQKLVTV